jgi:hypothetical protein
MKFISSGDKVLSPWVTLFLELPTSFCSQTAVQGSHREILGLRYTGAFSDGPLPGELGPTISQAQDSV